MKHKMLPSVLAAAVAMSVAADTHAADATGAGASFVYPVMSQWSADYHAATGRQVNYQSIGSSGGIAQIKAGTVHFGSSDKPLPLADIFLGKVERWNDPRIAGLNGGVPLPDSKITVVHRSDGSGTTFNFVNYLSKVSADWKDEVGEGTSVKWPTGIGGKGNEGVAAYVKQIKGGIGYVEMSYALQNRMAYTRLRNRAGAWVLPSDDSFSAAAASAEWADAQDFHLVMTDAPGEASWPITATNFILMHRQPKDAEGAKAAREFFEWVYASGDAQAKALDYVPLPDALVGQIEAYWSASMAY